MISTELTASPFASREVTIDVNPARRAGLRIRIV